MNDKKVLAFKLRKQGKSYNYITKATKVAKSTLSDWLRGFDWSGDIKDSLSKKVQKVHQRRLVELNNARKKKLLKWYKEAEKEAVNEFSKFKKDPLFLVGISLYWGEGDRVFKNGQVRLSNVNSKILFIFYKFLHVVCSVPKERIKAHVIIYPDLDSDKCLRFWSENVTIPLQNFSKPVLIQGRHKNNKLTNGVCSIEVSNKFLKRKILTWLDLLSNEMASFAGIV